MKNSSNKSWPAFLLATFIIPLSPGPHWQTFRFEKIKANQIVWQEGAIEIRVDQSASPLIYSFDQIHEVKSLQVEADLSALPHPLPSHSRQGEKGADDFVLRVGLILYGAERMSWWQRQLAPSWLIAMEKQLPPQWGIEKVLFFTTCRQKELLNQKRSHYLNSKFADQCVTLVEKAGALTIKTELPEEKKVIGLWLGSDGDDLKSKFKVKIHKIEITGNKTSL